MWVNLIIFLFFSEAYGGANCSNPKHSYLQAVSPCNRNYSTSDLTNQVHEIQDVVEWWGASNQQVANARCRSPAPPTSADMSEMVRANSNGRKVTKTVHGVRFENEPKELVDAFEKLTTRNSVYGGSHNVKEAQVNVQSLHQVNPACKKVSCAMEKIWGAELGQKILYIKLKHGYNASELAFDNATRFSVAEMNDVLMALEDLPPTLQPLGFRGDQRLVPYTVGQSVYAPGERVLANSGVIFFDRWREREPLTRQYTTFHELAHNISSRHENADNSNEWRQLSGWKSLGDTWEKNPNACMISKYGMETPAEDFAEVLSAYRYNPNTLETSCPEKYRYMKDKVFGGMEYKTNSQCARANVDQIANVQQGLADHLKENNYSLSPETIQSECAGSLNVYPPAQTELEACAFKASLKVIPQERLNDIIRRAGLPINASTRRAISAQLPANSPLRASLQTQSRQVGQVVEASMARYRSQLSQAQPPARGTNPWYQTQSRCGHVMMEIPEGALRCYVETLYEEDRSLKEWGAGFLPKLDPPAMFSEQGRLNLKGQDRQLVEEALQRSPRFLEQFRQTKADFKDNMLSAVREMKRVNSNLPQGWQDLPPQQFCSQVYGKSNLFLNIWGFPNGEAVKAIEEECVKGQTKNSRFHPSDADWQAWINSRWN